MPTVLITGVNRGIGLEFLSHYAGEGWRVIGTCRNPAAAESASAIADKNAEVSLHALDVTTPEEISALASELDGTPIDVLILNAGA